MSAGGGWKSDFVIVAAAQRAGGGADQAGRWLAWGRTAQPLGGLAASSGWTAEVGRQVPRHRKRAGGRALDASVPCDRSASGSDADNRHGAAGGQTHQQDEQCADAVGGAVKQGDGHDLKSFV